MHILYDGWPLAYAPNSPAALHLLTLLQAVVAARASGSSVLEATVALPAASFHALPQGTGTVASPTPAVPASRLRWEQRLLPRLARQAGAGWLHQVGGGLPLFGALPALASPAGFPAATNPAMGPVSGPAGGQSGLAHRLRQALGQGGLTRARAVLWPEDLPAPELSSLRRLPPAVHPAFAAPAAGPNPPPLSPMVRAELAALNLPDSYVLYHGSPEPAALRNLVDAWSWAAGSVADYYPLLLVGLDQPAQEHLNHLLAEAQLTDTARALPLLSLRGLAALYQGCSAVIQSDWPAVDPPPWGNPLRLALAAGKPVTGLSTPQADVIAGPAAYLVEAEDYGDSRRLLGGALITLLVEESMAAALGAAARQRAQAWAWPAFTAGLAELYRSFQ